MSSIHNVLFRVALAQVAPSFLPSYPTRVRSIPLVQEESLNEKKLKEYLHGRML